MKRDVNVDNLRGFAMIIMILDHAIAPFWKISYVKSIWEWTHFSVPLFVFCSLVIFFAKPIVLTWKSLNSYLKKRIKRLVVPYYIYLLVYFLLRYFLHSRKIDWSIIFKSLLFYWGGASWLVVLFLSMAVLMPFVLFLRQKNKFIFYLYGLISLLSAIYFSFYSFQPYQLIMWLPWSIFIYFSYFFSKLKNKKELFFSFIFFTLVFAGAYYFKLYRNQSLSLFNNKYPPNIYYLSYGLVATTLLYLLSVIGLFKNILIAKIVSFFSRYSYTLFFIHFLIIDIFNWVDIRKTFYISNWFIYFILIITLSYSTQKLLNFITNDKK